ncbi:hypothetical protein B0T20DRAFT_360601 [Sordaria brevicollis]|uniref:Serine protease n=1 Tax=Sordaria brevicollis TaxID=83679 RepID=A0AAE0P2U2_SORBR|nr:hypothetical protein B0T20DRAFT_360601 [Sordaria brevicollis]
MVTVRDILVPPRASRAIGAFWNITPPASTEPPRPESTRLAGNYEESVIDTDNRKPVDPADYRNGGKYRSIVKIRAQYEGSGLHWIGTGYLIQRNVLVTAGHVVFERDPCETTIGHGRAVSIECFIGYHGRATASEANGVQRRVATCVITTRQWVMDGSKRHDFALVKVDRDFDGDLSIMQFPPTPHVVGVDEELGVVGYPGDSALRVGPHGEDGALMHEMFRKTSWNLRNDRDNMLHYTIATGGGQSGGPVLLRSRDGNMVILGTHCYGDDKGGSNAASTIEGPYGNPLEVFEKFIYDFRGDSVRNIGFDRIESGRCCRVNAWKCSPSTLSAEAATESSNEDFFNILKSIGRVVTPVARTTLPIVSPLFGPLGGPISAIGGVALDALSKVVAESLPEGPVSTPAGARSQEDDASAHRAVLAEAALQTILRMEQSPLSRRILDDMQEIYQNTGFTQIQATRLGQKLVPIFTQVGVRFAVNGSFLNSKTDVIGKKVMHRHRTESNPAGPWDDDRDIEGFLHAISEHEIKIFTFSSPHGHDGESQPESVSTDVLWSFVCKGARAAKPLFIQIARDVAKTCYQKLDNWLVSQLDSGETAESSIIHDRVPAGRKVVISDDEAATLLVIRAVMAGCALEALLKADKEELSESHILGDSASVEPEAFFDSMLKTVQKIGPTVVNYAQTVTSHRLPPLLDALRAHQRRHGVVERPARAVESSRQANGTPASNRESPNGAASPGGQNNDRDIVTWVNGQRTYTPAMSRRTSASHHQVSMHNFFS